MREQDIQVLDQYEVNVNSTRKTRGAVLCDTEKGLMLLKKLDVSKKKISILCNLCECLQSAGMEKVDKIVENKEGNWISEAPDGTSYILKQWFEGKECDIRREDEVLLCVKNLAKIHRILRKVDLKQEEEEQLILSGEDLRNEYARHNREMKKVRSFIRKKVEKGDFEILYLKHFDAMYDLAKATEERLQKSGYETIWTQSREENRFIHGDYNYHNLFVTSNGIATTNFEHFRQDVQLADLYYFMRKVLEKNHWSTILGNRILEVYGKILPLGKDELEYLAVNISYPEKFWKAANSYYRSRKVFIPIKSLEKLEVSVRQMEVRKRFLEQIFSFHL